MTKVVSAKEMARVEKLAIEQGSSECTFMENAAQSIAGHLYAFIEKKQMVKEVTILAGKGNNGGDGYATAVILQREGFQVKVVTPYPLEVCSPLCRKQRELFVEKQGIVTSTNAPLTGVILDALLGTGFKGELLGDIADLILQANNSHLPILSVDMPSGLCGSTGTVKTVAICATQTIYLELPKIGFFLQEGPNYTGELVQGNFGLQEMYINQATAKGELCDGKGMQTLLPVLSRTRNKYSAGHVLVLAGSGSMMGAGTLVSHAALSSGAGIVRWFYPLEGTLLEGNTWPEVIKVSLNDSLRPFFAEMRRGSAIVLGPGMGRNKRAHKWIKKVLEKSSLPLVIDADALFFLSENPKLPVPKQAVLTPHTGEMRRLLREKSEDNFLQAVQEYVEKKQVTLLLKGSPNFLFSPGEIPLIMPFGNPGMATAGSGDVLSGIIGSLLAQKLHPRQAALLGCYLHGLAGDFAAKQKTPFCLTASDLVSHLGKAFSFLVDLTPK